MVAHADPARNWTAARPFPRAFYSRRGGSRHPSSRSIGWFGARDTCRIGEASGENHGAAVRC